MTGKFGALLIFGAMLVAVNVWVWTMAFDHVAPGEPDTDGAPPAPSPSAEPPTPSVTPVDVAPDLGIDRTIRSWGAAFTDLQGDGRPDLLIGRHSEAAPLLFVSNPGGGFDDVQTPLPGGVDRHGCAWADVDGNGLPDVYCLAGADRGTAAVKTNELWIQTEAGTFVDRTKKYNLADPFGRGRWPVFLDVNHDAHIDLFVSNAAPREDNKESPNRLFLNQGGQSFKNAAALGVTEEVGGACASAADYDEDGWTDILVCGNVDSPTGGLRLYRNREGTSFVDVTDRVGIADDAQDAVLADMDGDGDPDLVRVQQQAVLMQTQQDGAFGPYVTIRDLPEQVGRSVAVGDVNGDQVQDLYVVQGCADNNSRPPNAADLLLIGDGPPGQFTETTVPSTTEGCGDWAFSLDYDVDGNDDFLVLNGCCEGPEGLPVGPVQLITVPAGTGQAE